MILVAEILAELVIFLTVLVYLLDHGPVDVHLLAAATCGALFLLATRLMLTAALLTARVAVRVKDWWKEPPGQFWKRSGGWGEYR